MTNTLCIIIVVLILVVLWLVITLHAARFKLKIVKADRDITQRYLDTANRHEDVIRDGWEMEQETTALLYRRLEETRDERDAAHSAIREHQAQSLPRLAGILPSQIDVDLWSVLDTNTGESDEREDATDHAESER